MVLHKQCAFCGYEIFQENAIFVYLGPIYIQIGKRETRIGNQHLIFCTPACAGKYLRDKVAEA